MELAERGWVAPKARARRKPKPKKPPSFLTRFFFVAATVQTINTGPLLLKYLFDFPDPRMVAVAAAFIGFNWLAWKMSRDHDQKSS